VFVRKTYGAPATDTSKPMEQGAFRLYPDEPPSCYETAKGVGIHGRAGADVSERKSGMNWKWAVIGVPVVLILFWQYAPKVLASAWSTKKHLPVASTNAPVPAPGFKASALVSSNTYHGTATAPRMPVAASPPSIPAPDKVPVFMSGLAQVPGKPMVVYLSDGRHYKITDPKINYVARNYCIIDGTEYRMRF